MPIDIPTPRRIAISGDRATPLYSATAADRIMMMESLLDNGASVHGWRVSTHFGVLYNKRPLRVAQPDAAILLMRRGAIVDHMELRTREHNRTLVYIVRGVLNELSSGKVNIAPFLRFVSRMLVDPIMNDTVKMSGHARKACGLLCRFLPQFSALFAVGRREDGGLREVLAI